MAQSASLATIAKFFKREGETLSAFSKEWKLLPEADKEQIKAGFENGSMTY